MKAYYSSVSHMLHHLIVSFSATHADMMNATGPATLYEALRSEFSKQQCLSSLISSKDVRSTRSRVEDLIYHLKIHTLPDLVIFMYNLPSYLDAHPKVRFKSIISRFTANRNTTDQSSRHQLHILPVSGLLKAIDICPEFYLGSHKGDDREGLRLQESLGLPMLSLRTFHLLNSLIRWSPPPN